ncbi:hypothetical protein MKW94_022003 [Papaver nudicaule]|uniref:Uncharacterized protein n=1 Tax=Papaver nudicaule TaxID=74823 RepID=A0AA41S9L8_PAPNU|nr:hypothetical protein [Papaver nudicaule]
MESLTRRKTQRAIFIFLLLFICLHLYFTINSAPNGNEQLINSHPRKLLGRPRRAARNPPPPKGNPSKQFEVPPPPQDHVPEAPPPPQDHVPELKPLLHPLLPLP